MGFYVKVGLGLAMMAAGLGILALSIINLFDVGTCASGGPYEIANECPEGIEKWVGGTFGGVILFIIGIAVFAMRGGRATKAGLPSAQTDAGADWGRFGQFQSPGAGTSKPNAIWAKRSAVTAAAPTGAPPGAPPTPAASASPLTAPSATAAPQAGPPPPPAPAAPSAGAASQAENDSLDQLEKLNELRAKGAISEAEFAAAKARILGSL